MPCVPNFRLIGRQLTILETVKKVKFLWRHVTNKNVTSYVVGGSVFPKRLSTENILQPTRSLYDVWLKSYGPLCVFHVWGDLDLDLRPFKVIIYVWGQNIPISVNKQILKIFCGSVFVIWLYLTKTNVPSMWPWPMTYEGQLFFVNWLSAYKCPV